MADVVLDASAVVAYLRREPGREAVAAQLPGAIISTVNVAEVMTKLVEWGGDLRRAQDTLSDLAVVPVPFDLPLAHRTGALRPITRHLGLSLGDRACLALAQREGLPVYTADRRWGGLDIGVDVRIVR